MPPAPTLNDIKVKLERMEDPNLIGRLTSLGVRAAEVHPAGVPSTMQEPGAQTQLTACTAGAETQDHHAPLHV